MANAPFDPFGDRKPEYDDDLGDLAQSILRELRNASDIVLDAASAGKDELLRSVGEGVRSVRDAAREARDNAREARDNVREAHYRYTDDFNAAEEDYARQRQERKNRAKKQKKLRPVSRGANFLKIPSAAFWTPAAILGIVSLGQAVGGSVDAALPILTGTFSLCGAVPMIFSGKMKRKEKLYTRYLETVGQNPSVNLRFLAAQMDRKYDKCLEDLRDMVDRGYFGADARVDVAAGELIIDEQAARERKAQMDREREEEAQAAKTAANDSYEAMLTELQQLNVLIEDEDMSDKITRIETVATATFLAVRQKPEKAPSLRRFMDYYLPTTIKLLRSYAGFEHSSVQGENIRRSKENIEGMMETLCEAFEKQYDSLFLTETMDINAEIQTMDSLLRQDGYVGGADFRAAAAQQEKKK